MRNYITTHRCDTTYSALYKAHEDKFIAIAEGKDRGSLKETLYKMNKTEKELLDSFMYVRNSGLLFNKTNVDKLFMSTINFLNCWELQN